MIVGNPKAGRTLLTISVALLGVLLTIAAFVGLRKRTAPQKEPPLHPAGLVTTYCTDFSLKGRTRTESSKRRSWKAEEGRVCALRLST
jgi:hypothetical protein